MGHDDIYLWHNRIIKQKDVDNYLKKIGTWRENISLEKVIAFLIIFCASGVLLGARILSKEKNDNKSGIPNNSVKVENYQTEKNKYMETIMYDAVSEYTRK